MLPRTTRCGAFFLPEINCFLRNYSAATPGSLIDRK